MEEKKPFYKSVTFWSTILAAAGLIVPKYSTVINETAGTAAQIIGLVGVLIGRFRPGIKELTLLKSK
jgi:hypothetical protein